MTDDMERMIGIDDTGAKHYIPDEDDPALHRADAECGCNPDSASDDSLAAPAQLAAHWWNHHHLGGSPEHNAHRIVCYALGADPAEVGPWTSDAARLAAKLAEHALTAVGDLAPDPYDFVYVERFDAGTGNAIRVAFAGQTPDYHDARTYVADLTSRAEAER